jgi:hypothetical protein
MSVPCVLSALLILLDLINVTVQIMKFLFQNEINFKTQGNDVTYFDAVFTGKSIPDSIMCCFEDYD